MTQQLLSPLVTPPQIGQTDLERMFRKQNARQRKVEASSGWVGFSLAGFVTNYGSGYRNAAARRDQNGLVTVRGLLLFTGAIAAGGTIATLPTGMWPLGGIELFWTTFSNVSVQMNVNTNGTIVLPNNATANGNYLSLTPIRFWAD